MDRWEEHDFITYRKCHARSHTKLKVKFTCEFLMVKPYIYKRERRRVPNWPLSLYKLIKILYVRAWSSAVLWFRWLSAGQSPFLTSWSAVQNGESWSWRFAWFCGGHEQPNNQGACYRGRVTQFVMQQSFLGIKIDDIIIAVILGKLTCLVTVFAASCQVNIIVWAQTYVIYDWTSVQLVFKLSEVLTAW